MADFGPRANEVRAGLGADPSSGKLVETQVQSGRSSRSEKEADKQNKGFSGTPLWKIQEKLKKASEDATRLAAASAHLQVPDGFTPYEGALYWSEKRQCFWRMGGSGNFLVHDPLTGGFVDLCEEGASVDMTLWTGAACQDGPKHAKHVIIRDLCKASLALRMPITHVDRPCAMLALYQGRGGVACADFCAKHMHEKVLQKLSAYRGYWDEAHLAAAMREVFLAINTEYLEKHAAVGDSCAAAVALIMGSRLAVASVGNLAAVLSLRGGGGSELILPLAEDRQEQAKDLAWRTFFGRGEQDGAPAACGSAASRAAPQVSVVDLNREHQGLAFMRRSVLGFAGGVEGAADALRKRPCRPRQAAGALVDAAPPEGGAAAIVTFFDLPEPASASGPPPAKRAKAAEPTQVRIRHILLKHKDCKNRVDKARGGKVVTRSRAEAERILRKVLEDCESDPKRRSALFGQSCRELSECTTCLRGGDLAGDLAWVAKGKMGANFDEAAFALHVGQLSDLVDTDAGVHLLWRTA